MTGGGKSLDVKLTRREPAARRPTDAAAVLYAARGWPVFPCRPGTKEPATVHGFKDASTDPAVIRAWWANMPAANVAVATGAPGPDVLDVDCKHGAPGYATLNRLKRTGLLAGAQRIVKTPSGGLHLYYAGTDQGNGALARHGVDFRGAGGYVLAPPSVVAGTVYELLEERDAAGRLDQASIRRLLDPPRPYAPVRRCTPGDAQALIDWVARQSRGNRNQGLYWAARRAAEDGHDLAALAAAFCAAAVTAGLPELEARRTVASAARRTGGEA